jgi:hypothetical protein
MAEIPLAMVKVIALGKLQPNGWHVRKVAWFWVARGRAPNYYKL